MTKITNPDSNSGTKNKMIKPENGVNRIDDTNGKLIEMNISFWGFIYQSTKSIKGFLGLIGVLTIILSFFLILVFGILEIFNKKNVEIVQTSTGGLIYKIGKEETLSYLLSATDSWSFTGFTVNPNDKLFFKASGKINTALHHLITSAETDNPPDPPWIGPDGLDESKLFSKQDKYRVQFLLYPKARYGALIGGIGTKSQPPDRIENMFIIGSDQEITITQNMSGYLWIAVNEVMLAEEKRKAYELPEDQKEKNYHMPRTFDQIASDNYWNVWYDDNVGNYFVTVRKEKSK